MKKYEIIILPKAEEDIRKLRKSGEIAAVKKIAELIDELETHPSTGTGKPKPLSGDRAGQWSRRITQKHRLVYMIDDDTVVVLLLSAYGHYEDK